MDPRPVSVSCETRPGKNRDDEPPGSALDQRQPDRRPRDGARWQIRREVKCLGREQGAPRGREEQRAGDIACRPNFKLRQNKEPKGGTEGPAERAASRVLRQSGAAGRALDLPGLRAPLSADLDDHDGGAARCRADDAGYGGRFRDSPAARLRHRRRPRRVADSDPLYDASRLYLLRPAAELDDAGKKEAGALRPSRAAACGPHLTLSPPRSAWSSARRLRREPRVLLAVNAGEFPI